MSNRPRSNYERWALDLPNNNGGITHALLAVGETLKEISGKLDPLVEQATYNQYVTVEPSGLSERPNPVSEYFKAPQPDLLEQIQDERDALRMLLNEIGQDIGDIVTLVSDGKGERAYHGLRGLAKRIEKFKEKL